MQIAFYYDQTRCIGCNTCIVACKDWNDIPAGPAAWRKLTTIEKGKFPELFVAFLTTSCYHCEKPACVDVCPTKAIYKEEKYGTVLIDSEKCIGCRLCYEACTYGALVFASDKGYLASSNGAAQAPCTQGCPAHINIPRYVGYIAEGKHAEAMAVIREKIPFPSICGRVCFHPCETDCQRQQVDESISIKELKRYTAEHDDGLWKQKSGIDPATGKKVAVVGSGPAGLTAAYYLAKSGHAVTVFEALPEAGGMMMVGIPEYRLPKDILKEEIKEITDIGIKIKTGTRIKDPEKLLEEGYDTVFLATGAHQALPLPVPGTEAKGVINCVDFLRDVNLGKKIELPGKVVIIGGGNVAIDGARTALRLGADEVSIVCLEAEDCMPAEVEQVEETLNEGAVLYNLRSTKRILTEGGKVSGVEFVKLNALGFSDGQLWTDPIEDSEYTVSADWVILAIGQQPEIPAGLSGSNVGLTRHGTVVVDPKTLETELEGIFAGGDNVSGPASVIEAIEAGRQAAVAIDKFLGGKGVIHEVLAPPVQKERTLIPPDKNQHRVSLPTLAITERSEGFAEVVLSLSDRAAQNEAQRCLGCDPVKAQKCDMCFDRLEQGKKPICVDACPTRALDSGPIDELLAKYGDIRKAECFTYSAELLPSVVFKPKEDFNGLPVRKIEIAPPYNAVVNNY